jgi:hypothetical protein
MTLFANYRADRLIAEVKSSGNPGSPLAQKALEKLIALGSDAIDRSSTRWQRRKSAKPRPMSKRLPA